MDSIRDTREQVFVINDEYLNGYARLCGINATGVYLALCRHANKEQTCFPSKKLISDKLGISERSVYNALKILEEWNIIKIEQQKRKKNGSFKSNIYILMDKTSWKNKPQATGADGTKCTPPQANDDTSRRHLVPNKDTHSKGTHLRTVAANAADSVSQKISCKQEGCNKEVEEGKEFCKIHHPMNLAQFIEWCGENKQKHINIIGEWAETVNPNFRTQGQWTEYINRNLRPAKSLVPFDRDQLERGFEYIKKGITEKWLTSYTLETLYKSIISEKVNK